MNTQHRHHYEEGTPDGRSLRTLYYRQYVAAMAALCQPAVESVRLSRKQNEGIGQ